MLDLFDRELSASRLASAAVLARLGEILFIEAIRTYRLSLRPDTASWLGAAFDPNIGPVLQAVHASPSDAWTLQLLAEKASLSRSALASRFRELVGVPVMAHLTRLRMLRAAVMLEDPALTIAEVALRTGYQSVASFHRAFSREIGTTPGEFRTNLTRSLEFSRYD